MQQPHPYRVVSSEDKPKAVFSGAWGMYALIVACAAVHLAIAAFTAESQPDWSGLGWTPPN